MNQPPSENPDSEQKSGWLNNRSILCLLLFLSAFSLKLFFFFSLSQPLVFNKYPYFAGQLNKGIDIGERLLDLSPLYLYATVLLQKIYGPNWESMIVFQFFLGSLTILFIFLIGEKIFNRLVGLLAAVFVALYGNLILFEMTFEPESFVLFFNALLVLILLWVQEKSLLKPFPLGWLLAGLVLGLSVITKANALLFVPAALIWVFWSFGWKKEAISYGFFLVLGVFLVVLPVTVRNYAAFHDPVLITADMGKVFFHGNGPGATGLERADLAHQGFMEESKTEPDYAHTLFRTTARNISGRPLTPSECSRFWTSKTLAFLKTRPLAALRLFFKKSLFFWLDYEVHDIDSNYAYYQTIKKWPLVTFGILSALGLLGMIMSGKRIKQVYWPLVMVLGYILTVIIFFNASRYRLPAVPFLALFSAQSVVLIFYHLTNKQWIRGGVLLGTAGLLFLLSHLLFQKDTGALDRWQQATRLHYNLRGNFSFRKGDYQKALQEYQQAVSLAPNFPPAYNQIGKIHALLGDLSRAEKYFIKVVALSPTVDQGYMNLDFLYELKGEPSRALPFLEKALLLNPDNSKVREQIGRLKQSSLP